ERISDRLGKVEQVGIGLLRNYQLVFNRLGSYSPGGVASVVPWKGRSVFGVIWKLNTKQLNDLDEIEDPEAYTRESVSIEMEDGSLVDCLTYIAFSQGYHPPSKKYLSYLVRGAEEHDLPQRYTKNLRRRAVRQKT
ncbi:MAG: gamma-glutamylcyclotransferase, partial [Pseudomonadota bacterium]